MKITYCLVLLLPLLTQSLPAKSSLDPINAATDLTDATRIKRSGGFELVAGLQKTLLSGIGRASASFVAGSSGSSSSSSSSHSSQPAHPEEKPHQVEHFDGWQLKKSILNTLFQAVKAITGGVTALKGQLIKGSGYLVSGTGKIIVASGDAVSNVGKKIATSAHLAHAPSHSSKFAKLSGPLSSLSSGHSSSPSTSSSSSTHGHETPSGHSETFTSYDAPTSYGHDSPSGPSAPPAHHEVPAYLPPKQSSHSSSSYKSPVTSYGTTVDSHNTNYVADTGKYAHPIEVYPTGPDYLPRPGKSQTVVQASDVLRQILNKLPTTDKQEHHFSKPTVTQYEIPHDPPPIFKPIHSYLPAGLQKHLVGPLESVTHSHSITTAFGAPYPKSDPSLPSVYDVYRSMSHKMAAESPSSHNTISFSLSPPHHTNINHDERHIEHHGEHHEIHEEQLRELGKKLGNGIEIQKSISYDLSEPHTYLHKRSDVQPK